MLDWYKLQAEHRTWLEANFPSQCGWHAAAGMVEEAGELMRCVLKGAQSTLYGAESRYADVSWRDKLIDCVGDCAIFLVSLCNTGRGMCAAEVVSASRLLNVDPSWPMFLVCNELVRAATDVLGTLGNPLAPCMRYACNLQEVAQRAELSLDACVQVTWEGVRCRSRS